MTRLVCRFALASCAAALLVNGPQRASAQTIYQETFPFPLPQNETQDDRLRNPAVGWCGGNEGDPFCANPQNGAPPANNDGGEGSVSFGPGQDGDLGFAFWSQSSIGADSFLYTNPNDLPANTFALDSISWFQRDSSNAPPLHLAALINDIWHISISTFTQNDPNMWVEQMADLTALDFFERPQVGSLLPGSNVPTSPTLVSLPSGDVEAVGFWWEERPDGSQNSRIDNVTVQARVSP